MNLTRKLLSGFAIATLLTMSASAIGDEPSPSKKKGQKQGKKNTAGKKNPLGGNSEIKPTFDFGDMQKPAREIAFDSMDKNGDGFVTEEEADLAGVRGKNRGHFLNLDADGDGKVSKKEVMAPSRIPSHEPPVADPKATDPWSMFVNVRDGRGMPPFENLDKNRDGFIDVEDRLGFDLLGYCLELDADLDKRVTWREYDAQVSDFNRRHKSTYDGQPTKRNIDLIFASLDANEDDRIARAEAIGPIAALQLPDFKKVDLDNDGFVTKAELSKANPVPERDPSAPNMFGGKASPGPNGKPWRPDGPKLSDGALKGAGLGWPAAGKKAPPSKKTSKEKSAGWGKVVAEVATTLFRSQDRDRDGFVSKGEAKGPVADQFSILDADGDGKLTEEEVVGKLNMPLSPPTTKPPAK